MGPSRFPNFPSRRGWRKENESESSGDSDGDSQDHSDVSSGDEDSFVQDGVVGGGLRVPPTQRTPDPLPETEDNCGDEVDNDGDGVADCLDPDCADSTLPRQGNQRTVGTASMMTRMERSIARTRIARRTVVSSKIARDPVDNDGDGQGGCLDSDCRSARMPGSVRGWHRQQR